MVEEQPAQQPFLQLADRLRSVSAEPDLGATLEVAGDVLEGGDAATAARMLLDRTDAELGEGTWQEMVSALLAEQQARTDEPDAADRERGAPSAEAVDRSVDTAEATSPASTVGEVGDASAAGAGAADGDIASDDPLAAALRDFADELTGAATARARGDLDARQALARLKAGFHATRRTLAAIQREELRSRLGPAR